MFRDLRTQVTPFRRRLAAVLLLVLLLGVLPLLLHLHPAHLSGSPLQRGLLALAWALGAFLAIRGFSWLLLDPLLSHGRTATPGFARDLIVVALYFAASGFILHRVVGIDLSALVGTGAIAAAVVGLSLQEVLGNLFAGISLHLDPAFTVGDWVEVTGNLRGGPGRETLIGQVEAMTWRTVQLRSENGDTDIFPNRVLAQAVITNLSVPSGPHRRTLKVVIEPSADLHLAMDRLSCALGGIPHRAEHRPEVVVHSCDLGGAVLELRFWALGFRHGRRATFHAARLAATVLPREGFPLLGPHGATTLHPRTKEMSEAQMRHLLTQLGLPAHWGPELRGQLGIRHLAPGEGVIREGDPGESLFAVLSGSVQVVRVLEVVEPFDHLDWQVLATLGPGTWFGEGSLLTGAPRSATVVAAEATEVVELSKAVFEQSLRREPQVLEQLVDLMESRQLSREADSRPVPDRREQWTRQIRTWFGLGG